MLAGVRRHLSRHGEWWWVPVFYTLVVLWLYRGLWHQSGTATGFGWDVVDTHGPDLDFMARELREGRWSLWNPYDKGGYPVYADPIVCRYYPFAWPFVAFGALFGTSWWSIQVEVLAHHIALACCMHLFLRSRGLSVRAAMLGGVGLVVSAPLIVHKASNILWPLVWVPLVWLAIDAAIARPSWRRGAAVAAAFTLCATAGSPPGLFYAGLLTAPYGLWRVITERPAWRSFAPCVAVAGGLSALVLALTTIPTQTLVALGSREKLFASGTDFALSLSPAWRDAMRGVFVHAAGLPEMYLGATLVLLAAVAILQPRIDRGAPRLFGGVAIVGIMLACGGTVFLLPWLVRHVPGFALLRVPGRYKLLAAWSLAAAAAYGLDRLDRARPLRAVLAALALAGVSVQIALAHGSGTARPVWWSIVAAVAPAVLVLAALPRRRWLVPVLAVAAVAAPVVTVGIVAVAALACALAPLRPWLAPVFVVCVLVDAPAFTIRADSPRASDVRRLHAGVDATLARLDGVRDRYRLYDEFVLGERVGQRRAVRDFRGYPAVDPLSQVRYYDVLLYAKLDPAILTDFNVRWVLHSGHFRFANTASFVATLPHEWFTMHDTDPVFEARYPAPLVAWYGRVELVGDPHQVLPAMRALQRPTGERAAAVVEPFDAMGLPLARLVDAPSRTVEGTLVAYEPDAIATEIDAPADGLVVLNELAYPGWQVEVDGEPAPLLRANYLLRAVHVTAGHHAITWRFVPPRFRLLAGGYLFALAVMLGAAVWPRRRSRARVAAR